VTPDNRTADAAAVEEIRNREGVRNMHGKKVIIGQHEWAIPDSDVVTICTQIRTAMSEGSVAELVLLDTEKRPVTVYVNCRIVESIVVDTDGDPRPSEWSG
jgi:hypothetical protein